MTRQAQLQFCKVCVNQQKDLNFGIVCGLNGQTANFDSSCESYREDSSLKARLPINSSTSVWFKKIDIFNIF
ncbi:hypothetical protein [Aurantibacter sp.]|uniref:hypothetical protein n=1 Tax=Aurantibacter sp. TaxID=2807103 RepID=UPI003267AFAE